MNRFEQIRTKVRQLDAMPTMPTIMQPLAAMLQAPVEQVSTEEVIKLISYDTTIAAQCLRVANSPLFGRRKSETVRSAVLALGLKRVQAILLGFCLDRIVPDDKWALDAAVYWRHSLGCALVSRKLATLIGYPEPEKAYLAGLLHDLGILVNTLVFTDEYRQCVLAAREKQIALHRTEEEKLGFTHSQSGKLLAEAWRFSPDMIDVVEFHHHISSSTADPALVALVHLGDLLCRLRDLGYGYYEAMGVDLAADEAWAILLERCPQLAKLDLVRVALDIDGAMQEIVTIVDEVFRSGSQQHP